MRTLSLKQIRKYVVQTEVRDVSFHRGESGRSSNESPCTTQQPRCCTARVAADKGDNVNILSDCTAGRSAFEQEFYCSEIFPIFSTVSSVDEILAAFSNRVAA